MPTDFLGPIGCQTPNVHYAPVADDLNSSHLQLKLDLADLFAKLLKVQSEISRFPICIKDKRPLNCVKIDDRWRGGRERSKVTLCPAQHAAWGLNSPSPSTPCQQRILFNRFPSPIIPYDSNIPRHAPNVDPPRKGVKQAGLVFQLPIPGGFLLPRHKRSLNLLKDSHFHRNKTISHFCL